MKSEHRFRRLGAGAIIALALGAGPTALAGATTGATPLAHPPRYKVTKEQARPFIGTFKLKSHGPALISGALVQRFNEAGFFEGTIVVYQYWRGRPSSWVGTTYEYHQVGNKMHIDVWSPNGQGTPLLARMVLTPRGTDLVGAIRLIQRQVAHPQKVVFAKTSS